MVELRTEYGPGRCHSYGIQMISDRDTHLQELFKLAK